MEITDGDLSGFVDAWKFADQAESTVLAYVECLSSTDRGVSSGGWRHLP